MKRALNFVVQSTLSTINIALKSTEVVLETALEANTFAKAGVCVAKDRTRRKLVPSNVKNQALQKLSYMETVQAIHDVHHSQAMVLDGRKDYKEHVGTVATLLANAEFFNAKVSDIKERVERELEPIISVPYAG